MLQCFKLVIKEGNTINLHRESESVASSLSKEALNVINRHPIASNLITMGTESVTCNRNRGNYPQTQRSINNTELPSSALRQ